jgi:hypothetical protein
MKFIIGRKNPITTFTLSTAAAAVAVVVAVEGAC